MCCASEGKKYTYIHIHIGKWVVLRGEKEMK